jgi:flagellar protein FliJ
MTAPFRLRRLLDLREQHEQAMARNLAHARGSADDERRASDDLRRARETSLAHVAGVAANGTTMGELVSLNFALRELDQHAVVADERTRAADAHVDACHEALAIAARARMILDRLKTRHNEAARAEENATDLKTMDAVALSRHGAENRARTPQNHRKVR